MTTRRWFEFVSTRYHSSGSISTHVPSVLFLSLSHPRSSLRRTRYLDSPASFSVALYTAEPASSSSLGFVPDTRRESGPLPSLPLHASSSRDSRIGSRSTSLRLFPSLSRSIFLCRTAYQSVSPSRASRICFLAPVLPFLPLAPSSAIAPLAGPLSVESLCARQAGHREVKQEEKEKEASSRSIAKH